MATSIAEQLAKSERSVLIAPAGCGKTYTIAEAVKHEPDGRQLILTHTHAGVHALRERMRKNGVPSRKYHIDTIAGWALKLAASYPTTSKIGNPEPMNSDWKDVYESATRLVSDHSYGVLVKNSYSGIYIDEYQDCTATQHALVLSLAEWTKCRVLGDPLQGIFDFTPDDPMVNWDTDIIPNFEKLPELTDPWRWKNTNPELGKWLLQVRDSLLDEQPIDFTIKGIPCQRGDSTDYGAKRQICYTHLRNKDRVVVIGEQSNVCHSFARGLGGKFESMEEVYSTDLLNWADKIENVSGQDRALAVLNFAKKCLTGMTELNTVINYVNQNKVDKLLAYKKYPQIGNALAQVMLDADLARVIDAMDSFRSELPGSSVFRSELWYEMRRSIILYGSGQYSSLYQAAWQLRNRTSQIGRRINHKMVSRTLLVKGLEFDHAVILNANVLGPKDLYVAMTRGSKSLTVFYTP